MHAKPRREFAATWHQMKVFGAAAADTIQFVGKLSGRYDLHLAYENAHAKKKPDLSPHGFFRKLRSGDNEQAKEFLETFGPLKLEPVARLSGCGDVIVNLAEFWSLHRRYCLIAEVLESLNDRKQLQELLFRIYVDRQEISKYAEFPLGQIFGLPPAFEKKGEFKFPWEAHGQEAKEWLGSAPIEEMHEFARRLIFLELNAHTKHLRIVWDRGWETTGRKLREVVWVDSLWSAIWESWGWDTNMPWRRCPHCQRLFYPKRRDQFYCTPRQQALWSKRRYAAARRTQERRQKKRNI